MYIKSFVDFLKENNYDIGVSKKLLKKSNSKRKTLESKKESLKENKELTELLESVRKIMKK